MYTVVLKTELREPVQLLTFIEYTKKSFFLRQEKAFQSWNSLHICAGTYDKKREDNYTIQ